MSLKERPVLKKLFKIFFFCIILLILYFIVRPSFQKESDPHVEDIDLLNAVNSINSELPLMIDEDTELSSIQFNDKTLQYHFRLPLVEKDSIQLDHFRKKMITQFKEAYCGEENIMLLLREKKYSVSYIYKDKNYTIITDLFLEPQDCPKK